MRTACGLAWTSRGRYDLFGHYFRGCDDGVRCYYERAFLRWEVSQWIRDWGSRFGHGDLYWRGMFALLCFLSR